MRSQSSEVIMLFRNFRHVNSRKSVDAELSFARGPAVPTAKQEKNHARALTAFVFAFAAFFSGSLQAQTFAPTPGIAFTKPFGGAEPLPQILTVAAVGTAFSFAISTPTTSSGGSWLAVLPAPGCCYNTPHAVEISVNPIVTLAAGPTRDKWYSR